MCCGKSRAVLSQTGMVSPANRGVRPSPAVASRQRSSVAYFEYTGKTALTVIGRVTRTSYRFSAPGSRLSVDLRDRAAVAAVPGLAQVQSL